MSFLDESSATLLEALAFIDACEPSSDSSNSNEEQCRPRKSPKIGYWERLRAERESLREQAAELEATLQLLQTQSKAAERVNRQQRMLTKLNSVETATHAEEERQRRLEAEKTNSRLKDLVARNYKAVEMLTCRVSARSLCQYINLTGWTMLLNRLRPKACSPFCLHWSIKPLDWARTP